MTADEKMREAFEKWYGSSPERCSKYPAQYLNVFTQARWEAWQAAQQAQVSEEIKVIRSVAGDLDEGIIYATKKRRGNIGGVVSRACDRIEAALAAIQGGGK